MEKRIFFKKSRIFRLKVLEYETGRRIEEVLKDKLNGELTLEEAAVICNIPFEVLKEQLADPKVNRVKTPIGDFLKYDRDAYNNYDPATESMVVRPKTTRIKFLKSDSVQVNLEG